MKAPLPDRILENTHGPGCAGVDEAGRGPLAGPVVAAALIFRGAPPPGIADSKRLSAGQRARIAQALEACADIGVGLASVEEIDRLNILQATLLAMHRAVSALPTRPRHILVDGNRLPRWPFAATAVVRGDTSCLCIAAASIIAKTRRDAMMDAADRRYPGYGWGTNRGYGTATHLEALRRLGPTPLHRLSFAPVRASAARSPKPPKG